MTWDPRMETPLQEALPCGRETDPFRGDVPALETKNCENKVTCQARGWACWKTAPPCAWGAARVSPACRAYHRVTWSRGGRQVRSRYSPRVMGTDSSHGGGESWGAPQKPLQLNTDVSQRLVPPAPFIVSAWNLEKETRKAAALALVLKQRENLACAVKVLGTSRVRPRFS